MRNDEPNWGLAFGSGSFLIVWCLGFAASVPFEVLIMRGTVAAILGTMFGVIVGYTVNGLRALREDLDKGSRVDFTVGDGDDEAPLPSRKEAAAGEADGEVRERVVPQAGAAEAQPVGFEPLDYKAAAKQVQSMVQE